MKSYCLRLSDDEFDIFNKKASQTSLSKNEYLRTLLLSEKVPVVICDDSVKELVKGSYAVLEEVHRLVECIKKTGEVNVEELKKCEQFAYNAFVVKTTFPLFVDKKTEKEEITSLEEEYKHEYT